MKFKLLITAINIFSYISLLGQSNTQTIRGKLFDQDTKMALIGANVVIVGSDPIIGSISDINGNFRLNNVPIGRTTLLVSYIGYEEKVISNIIVGLAKEIVLDIKMEESFEKLDEIIVTATDKAEVLNEMALVSARTFSVEETKRFAGSFGDPARMVSGFAGVANQAEGNNDIIVRGNSPRGILWRLEGIEIPNPNHFASDGSTGGPINALNGNMLSDSDFLSGAFAPEYGNALSGVFDMHLKKGNNESREYNVGLSTLGIDLTVEGPFKSGYGGSYLANYRYSSLDLLDKAGIVDFGGVPKYQDLSFKVFLPLNKKHNFSIFGLGGINSITTDTQVGSDSEILGQYVFKGSMGTIGVTHNYLINNKSYLRTSLSLSGTGSSYQDDLIDEEGGFYSSYNSDFDKTYFRISSSYNFKINNKNKFEAGVIVTRLGYNIHQNSWDFDVNSAYNLLSDDGYAYRHQSFISWKYRFMEDLTLIGGLHANYFDLNKSSNLEPRLALKWNASETKSFNIGFGLHSKMESISTYLYKDNLDDNNYIQPNKNLSASKAAHFILGFDQSIGSYTHLKIETYYQHLYDVPVEVNDASTLSLINSSSGYIDQTLVNDGTGKNYGVELTLEQYLHKGFYYMASASVFNSLYTPQDGIERKTAYANDYIFNVLMGKEFNIGQKSKNRVLFVNGKVSLIGGKRYTPVNLEASIDAGYQIRYYDQPFSKKSDDIFIANLSIGLRRDKGRTTREFKIDVQNLTNNQAVVNEYFIEGQTEIYESTQLAMFPSVSYTLSF